MTNINKQEWEENLRNIQKAHLDKLRGNSEANWRPCMHDQCSNCHGTGVDSMGRPCIHGISCPCPRCSPSCM